MKTSTFLLLLVIFLPWQSQSQERTNPLPSASATGLSSAEVFAKAESAVFKVLTRLRGGTSGRGHGTAFAVHPEGFLITNYHVVADALADASNYELELVGRGTVEVVDVDPVNDLALLRVKQKFENFLSVAGGSGPQKGEQIYSLGFPKSEEKTIIQGTYNGVNVMGFAPVMAASMPLNPGMSGGPTLNSDGKVVGVNRALRSDAQSISYFSPASALYRMVMKANHPRTPAQADLGWRKGIVSAIHQQERIALNYHAQQVKRQGPRTERLGPLNFSVPVPGVLCDQDADFDGDRKKSEFTICRAVGLSMVDSDLDSLQYQVLASREMGGIDRNSSMASGFVESMRARSLKKIADDVKKGRRLASLESLRASSDLEKCNLRNVKNKSGIEMTVHFCSVRLPKFEGLHSTFMKVYLRDARGHLTTVGKVFEGLSMTTTARLIEEFLDSITWGGVHEPSK